MYYDHIVTRNRENGKKGRRPKTSNADSVKAHQDSLGEGIDVQHEQINERASVTVQEPEIAKEIEVASDSPAVYVVTEKDFSYHHRKAEKYLPLRKEEGGKSVVYFAPNYTNNIKPLFRNQAFY